MSNGGEPKPASLVRRAAERGAWDEVHALLATDGAGPIGPDVTAVADVAYAAGRLDVTITTWERAHARALQEGDPVAAAGAAVRVAMHLLFDTGLMAPVRGWLTRAERLLPPHPETPVHAWLAVVRSYERLLSGDLENARQWARQAVLSGARTDAAAAAVGRVAEARCLIAAGEVADGLELLNEAAVAAASGELDALPSGVVYCEVVCALQALAQYDLAEQWTAAMEAWRHSGGVGSIHGRCRVHRAEILRLRGSLREAEEEALQACEEMRPYVGRELGWPLTELGRIRLRSGDLEGAEQAFRTAHEIGWDPYPGLALVYLAKGEGAAAVHTIRDALERPLNVPSKELPPNTDLRRAPLLAAQVEIETMSEGGDLRLAGAAAEELGDIARTYRSTALEATAAMAHGLVSMAEGEAAAAKQSFDVALQLWSAVGAPYETARARLGLARAHRALGAERRALLELDVARSTFERLGARRDAAIAKRETGAEPVGYGQSPPDGPRGADRRVPGDNVLRREGDHWLVVFDGRSVRVRDLKGLHYLARLVVHPGRELHACDLTGSADGFAALGGSAEAWEDDAPLLDRQAKDAYRRRLEEIDEDLEQARDQGDEERCVQGELERSILARELARAVGLGGRDRRSGSRAERGRVSVTRALRRAIERLREHHAELAEHLHRSVRTGTYCAYLPDPRARCTWKVSDTD